MYHVFTIFGSGVIFYIYAEKEYHKNGQLCEFS